MKLTPLQQHAYEFMLRRDYALILGAPGTGKTLPTLGVLRTRTPNDRALIIAPPIPATTSWPEDNKKFGIDLEMRHWTGGKKIGEEQVTIVTPDSLPGFKKAMAKANRCLSEYKTLVIDEAHAFKVANTTRYRGLSGHVKKFNYRIALTGTPRDELVDEFFAICRLVDGGNALGTTVVPFRGKYMEQHTYTKAWSNREGALDQVVDLMYPFTISLNHTKDSLPALQSKRVFFSLPDSAREIYNRLDKNFSLEEFGLRALPALQRANKLKQIVSGGILDEGGVWRRIHDARLKKFGEVIREVAGRPLLVFYEFRGDMESIQAYLREQGIGSAPTISGDTPKAQIKKNIDDFNAGTVPILLGQVAAAGTGGNFQRVCHDVCFFSRPGSLRLSLQALGRVWRLGQTQEVTAYYLLAQDTTDIPRETRVERKEASHKEIFNRLDVTRRYP